jgi:pimeloyl-ACP methyl ester carboxylesterase
MAKDIHVLLHQHLQVHQALIVVGHDIGSMVAFAYAEMFREEVSHLVVMDAPLPGTAIFDRLRADPRVWHFAFHGARDIPEMLVAGRERPYLQAFFNARIFNPSGVRESDLDIYTSAYSAPGAMRAGFETYRSFDQDARDNRGAVERNGKLKIPVLAVWGEISNTGPGVEAMMHEVAENVAAFKSRPRHIGSPRKTPRHSRLDCCNFSHSLSTTHNVLELHRLYAVDEVLSVRA